MLASILANVGRDLVGVDGRITRDDVLALLVNAPELLEELNTRIVEPYGTTSKDTPFGKLVQFLKAAVEASGNERILLAADALVTTDGIHEAWSIEAIRGLLRAADTFAKAIQRAEDDDTEANRKPVYLAATDLALATFELAFQSLRTPDEAAVKALEAATDAVRHFVRREWQDGGRDVLRLLVVLQTNAASNSEKETVQVLIRTLTFVVDAASAETPDEFKAALESAAAPLGGWRAKTKGFVASFGAMAGVRAGGELLLEGNDLARGAFVAPVAMLGFDLAWPIPRSTPGRRSSVGLFVSVIDVGQLASQRWLNGADDVNEEDCDPNAPDECTGEVGVSESPKIGIVQVLSPGLHVRFGIAETPITVLLGASAAPDLRERRANPDAHVTDAWVLQVGLGLAIDVTLFPIGRRLPRSTGS